MGNGYVHGRNGGGRTCVLLREIGANLMLVDYRGYGSSSDLRPDETNRQRGCGRARASASWMGNTDRRYDCAGQIDWKRPRDAQLARNDSRGLGGLILESLFSSIDDAAAGISVLLRMLRLGLLLPISDNLSKIASVHAPVLIVWESADTLTPDGWRKGYFAGTSAQQVYFVEGAGHDDLLIAEESR